MNHVQDARAVAFDPGLVLQILLEPVAAVRPVNARQAQDHRRELPLPRRFEQHPFGLDQNLRRLGRRFRGAGSP